MKTGPTSSLEVISSLINRLKKSPVELRSGYREKISELLVREILVIPVFSTKWRGRQQCCTCPYNRHVQHCISVWSEQFSRLETVQIFQTMIITVSTRCVLNVDKNFNSVKALCPAVYITHSYKKNVTIRQTVLSVVDGQENIDELANDFFFHSNPIK